MTSPSENYSQAESAIRQALNSIELGGLEHKFEGPDKPLMALPTHVGFYQEGQRVGEVYFLESPVRVKVLDGSFESYAQALKSELNL